MSEVEQQTDSTKDFHILVVDDDEVDRLALCQLIEADEYRVIGVGSSREALGWLSEGQVDLVITDLMMPDLDGWDLLKIIKRKWPCVHVVATTGNISEQAERLLTSRRADGYLVKPIILRRLQIMLSALLWPRNLDRPTEAVVLDRDRVILETVDSALGDRGVYVATFSDLQRATYFVNDDPPDLLITEIALGKQNGFELCEEIRANRRLPYIPILIISGWNTAENIRRAAKIHINGFLVKPFDSEAFCERALELLRHGREALQKAG